jgi:prepilin-type N-terminal cleavage/methylation domain-containing protein
MKNNWGFTLIEIMIVVMIIVAMTGFVTANYAMF